jgi:hypothetical protein
MAELVDPRVGLSAARKAVISVATQPSFCLYPVYSSDRANTPGERSNGVLPCSWMAIYRSMASEIGD